MAGSWNERVIRGLDPKRAEKSMFSVAREFTADAADSSVPDWELLDMSPAFLADIGIVFDGTTPPDSVTITVKDIDGLTAFEETGITASQRISCTDRPSLILGTVVSISGNTTDSAKAKVILNFANNHR